MMYRNKKDIAFRNLTRGFFKFFPYLNRRTILIFFIFCCLFAMIAKLTTVASSTALGPVASYNTTDLKKLYLALNDSKLAASLNTDLYRALLNTKKISEGQFALWPVCTFLFGEVLRLRGDNTQAKRAYQRLVEWAGSEDPNKDEWGLSGLVTVALWRWLQYSNADSDVTSGERAQLLELGSKLLYTRFFQGMFETLSIFGSLPQLREEILRKLVAIAFSLGKKEEAQNLLIEYFKNSSNSQLSTIEKNLLDESISSGVFSLGHVAVFRGKHLAALGNYEGAFSLFSQALEIGNTQVQAEASLLLAELKRKLETKCLSNELFQLFDRAINYSTNPDIVHEALLWRARTSMRDGCPKDQERFKADMKKIIADCPECYFTDDALFELASFYLDRYWENSDQANLKESLKLFSELQNFKGINEYADSCWLRPALGLYSRGESEDIKNARALLTKLEEKRPFGPLHTNALFWLGRLAEESGDAKEAESCFKKLIQETPYNYYAIRAQMHLDMGVSAKHILSPDNAVLSKLAKSVSKKNNEPAATSPGKKSFYQDRLESLLSSEIYATTVRAYSQMRRAFPSERLEVIALEELDKKNLLSQLAILLAARQDALAAIDKLPEANNRLEIARMIGALAFDLPMAIYIVEALDKPVEVLISTQNQPGYLAVAYPKVYTELITKYATEYQLPPALLYSVVRRETAFCPDALSSEGGLGLFQFIPLTFDSLNKRYNLLVSTGKKSREEYLLDPELSLSLGARYLKEELLNRYKGDIFFALMDHIAGAPAVREWKAHWKRINKLDDFEFMIDSAGFLSVGPFVRAVLANYWIAQLLGQVI